jgi:hypothetical protein
MAVIAALTQDQLKVASPSYGQPRQLALRLGLPAEGATRTIRLSKSEHATSVLFVLHGAS